MLSGPRQGQRLLVLPYDRGAWILYFIVSEHCFLDSVVCMFVIMVNVSVMVRVSYQNNNFDGPDWGS